MTTAQSEITPAPVASTSVLARAFEVSLASHYEGNGTAAERARAFALLIVRDAAKRALVKAAARAFKAHGELAALAAASAIAEAK